MSLAREAAFAVLVPLTFPALVSWRKEKHNTDWKSFGLKVTIDVLISRVLKLGNPISFE